MALVCGGAVNRFVCAGDGDTGQNHWSLWFFAGLFPGGAVGQFALSKTPISMSPESYYSSLGLVTLMCGGLAIGFGTRYAEGCTSGHAVSGLSNLQKASLFASVIFSRGD